MTVVEPATAREVTMGATTFYFGKLLAMEQYDVLELVREGLEGPLGKYVSEDTDPMRLALGILAGIPRETVEAVRQRLFSVVEWRNDEVHQPGSTNGKLAGDEASAFKDLTGAHVMEVLGRAFVVNFTESWEVLDSRIPEVGQALRQLAT